MLNWLDSFENILTTSSREDSGNENSHWRSLSLYLLYRITLSLTLIFFFYSGAGPSFLGSVAADLFSITSALYVALSFLSVLFFLMRSPNPEKQTYLALFVDIAAITLLMHASGGVQTGMGMLIAVSVIAGALIIDGRAALLFAALAALAVIANQIYVSINETVIPPRFVQAGFLGAVFFATALLTLVMSSRLRASEKLAQERANELNHLANINAYVIRHMRTGVLVVDSSGMIVMINDPAWCLLGMPTSTTGGQLVKASPELAHMLRKHKAGTKRRYYKFRTQRQGPELRAHFNPVGTQEQGDMLIFLEDTSQITREAQQMKLASLGRLTASIAHEIRNPLGAISHASQLFDESPSQNPADQRLTEIIKTNTARLNQVIENVLQLSRRDPGNPKKIALKSWLQKLVEDLVKHQGFARDDLLLQIEPENTEIVADPEQLRQVVTNLCNNAREHGKKEGLKLQIIGGIMKEFDHPVVDVIDNGPGIAPKVARQIFEPFFTTRNSGTGLGLYIAKELSDTNHIRLEYIPGPTGGSCFRLHFDHWQPRSQTA
ncbi:MAG: histidine kinase [Candidatus Thiodiazotropha sp. (ex Ctena orbiculata)]|nr:histidine kinase [Candidatus Thiodiazotropha taylori]MBT2996048.1 histidine kinase [Candidatus Thiodiazotropha taylori]MBT3001584.1 histidine kinase [Candidatus Thiodiazotropha taylori]MBV2105463.1 histidine kinase [Candidatus Thiodiazotropha taylori]MBV2111395.1 histidine kinase [Candidatus Thiodiazotropha taylori]